MSGRVERFHAFYDAENCYLVLAVDQAAAEQAATAEHGPGWQYVEPVQNADSLVGDESIRYVATFSPQAWSNDQAIPVDPQGEDSWDCTAYVAVLEATSPGWLARTMANGAENYDGENEGRDHDDLLRNDPAAPEWVREWRGPFDTKLTVEVEA